jgi:hypothetical protein
MSQPLITSLLWFAAIGSGLLAKLTTGDAKRFRSVSFYCFFCRRGRSSRIPSVTKTNTIESTP